MTVTKYIVTTFIGRQKRYIFGTGKTTGNKLQVEYSTKQVDAEVFETEALAKEFIKNISNPYERVFTVEGVMLAAMPLQELMATLPVVDEKKLDRKTVITKAKKLR